MVTRREGHPASVSPAPLSHETFLSHNLDETLIGRTDEANGFSMNYGLLEVSRESVSLLLPGQFPARLHKGDFCPSP